MVNPLTHPLLVSFHLFFSLIMAKSRNIGLAKLQTPVSTESGKTEAPARIFPPSPTSTCTFEPSSPQESDADEGETDACSVHSCTPRDSKRTSARGSSSMENTGLRLDASGAAKMPSDISLLAIAQLQASMKEALQGLANVMDHVGKQSALINQLAAQIKERNEVNFDVHSFVSFDNADLSWRSCQPLKARRNSRSQSSRRNLFL